MKVEQVAEIPRAGKRFMLTEETKEYLELLNNMEPGTIVKLAFDDKDKKFIDRAGGKIKNAANRIPDAKFKVCMRGGYWYVQRLQPLKAPINS